MYYIDVIYITYSFIQNYVDLYFDIYFQIYITFFYEKSDKMDRDSGKPSLKSIFFFFFF